MELRCSDEPAYDVSRVWRKVSTLSRQFRVADQTFEILADVLLTRRPYTETENDGTSWEAELLGLRVSADSITGNWAGPRSKFVPTVRFIIGGNDSQ